VLARHVGMRITKTSGLRSAEMVTFRLIVPLSNRVKPSLNHCVVTSKQTPVLALIAVTSTVMTSKQQVVETMTHTVGAPALSALQSQATNGNVGIRTSVRRQGATGFRTLRPASATSILRLEVVVGACCRQTPCMRSVCVIPWLTLLKAPMRLIAFQPAGLATRVPRVGLAVSLTLCLVLRPGAIAVLVR